jgi:hypothetical protein
LFYELIIKQVSEGTLFFSFWLNPNPNSFLYCGLAKLWQVYAYSIRMPLLNSFLAFLELVCSRRSSRYARVQFLSCT